ncbi:MAG: hypothetical protein OER91_06415 [Gammaproteobacteria bacterium]|nr:hypothetical protein [Gammaproteobacteria bacterium]
MSRLTAKIALQAYSKPSCSEGTIAINTDKKTFDDCVILKKDAFDPDAVFLDDIVDDEVLPYLSLEVDGLTSASEGRKGQLELRPEDVAANEPIPADTTMPVAVLGPEELEVYGWESSLWKKIKGYLGF